MKKLVKILVPCLIVAAIAGIYLYKNPPASTQIPENPPESTQAPEDSTAPENADFALIAAGAIDFETLAGHGLPIIVDYGSDSCIPCQQMAPVLETMNEEMNGKAIIKFVDVWEYAGAASNVPIQVIPTQVLINADGTPFVPSDGLAQEIAFTRYSSRETGEHVFTVHQGGLTEEQMRLILTEMGVEV